MGSQLGLQFQEAEHVGGTHGPGRRGAPVSPFHLQASGGQPDVPASLPCRWPTDHLQASFMNGVYRRKNEGAFLGSQAAAEIFRRMVGGLLPAHSPWDHSLELSLSSPRTDWDSEKALSESSPRRPAVPLLPPSPPSPSPVPRYNLPKSLLVPWGTPPPLPLLQSPTSWASRNPLGTEVAPRVVLRPRSSCLNP